MKTTAFALLVVVGIACGSTDAIEPTPDVPLFADGEAVALVKAGILKRIRDGNPGGHRCIEQVYVAQGKFLRGTTTASYLGGHVWAVASLPFEVDKWGATTTLEWRVYEASNLVEPANDISVSSMGC